MQALITIIAGSRTVTRYNDLLRAVKAVDWTPAMVISGTAGGADRLGERWATENMVPLIRMPANWDKYGSSAGPIRNEQMLSEAEALIALWGWQEQGDKAYDRDRQKKRDSRPRGVHMKEIDGDIWRFNPHHWVCITTNGDVKNNGQAVMGRGTALQAARKFPGLPLALGQLIKAFGNHVLVISPEQKLIALPVKHHWQEFADPELIKRSIQELIVLADLAPGGFKQCYLTRPGCGNGKLFWGDVKPLLAPLDERFTVVHMKGHPRNDT